jgi:hypothetical protein
MKYILKCRRLNVMHSFLEDSPDWKKILQAINYLPVFRKIVTDRILKKKKSNVRD